jgi:hypothetical protein
MEPVRTFLDCFGLRIHAHCQSNARAMRTTLETSRELVVLATKARKKRHAR